MPAPAWLANLQLHSPAEEISALLAALAPAFEQRFVRVSAELGLTRAQAQLLAQLPGDVCLSQREMSERLHCAPSSIVSVIDSLEKPGWLARQVDITDRRIKMLVLTREGQRMRDELMRRLLDPPAAIGHLPEPAQAQLRDLLRALLDELGAPA